MIRKLQRKFVFIAMGFSDFGFNCYFRCNQRRQFLYDESGDRRITDAAGRQ